MEAWKEELYHHGVKGMRWGVRRYQREDGTRTALGKRRENEEGNRKSLKGDWHRFSAKIYDAHAKAYAKSNKTMSNISKTVADDQRKKALEADRAAAEKRANRKGLSDKQKTALKIGGAAAATAVAAYGAYKLNKVIGDKNQARNKHYAETIIYGANRSHYLKKGTYSQELTKLYRDTKSSRKYISRKGIDSMVNVAKLKGKG